MGIQKCGVTLFYTYREISPSEIYITYTITTLHRLCIYHTIPAFTIFSVILGFVYYLA